MVMTFVCVSVHFAVYAGNCRVESGGGFDRRDFGAQLDGET